MSVLSSMKKYIKWVCISLSLFPQCYETFNWSLVLQKCYSAPCHLSSEAQSFQLIYPTLCGLGHAIEQLPVQRRIVPSLPFSSQAFLCCISNLVVLSFSFSNHLFPCIRHFSHVSSFCSLQTL